MEDAAEELLAAAAGFLSSAFGGFGRLIGGWFRHGGSRAIATAACGRFLERSYAVVVSPWEAAAARCGHLGTFRVGS